MSILYTENLKKTYGSGDAIVRALDGVDLIVEQGEYVSIMGTSGSGKSTLLNMLGGLDVPTEGKVVVGGKDISKMDEEDQTVFRRREIGFVFQNYNLLPLLNVYENIVLPLELDGVVPDEKYVGELLNILGLKEKKYATPGQLSGGQQQRVAMARALASKPAIILADEPTGNLDSKTNREVLSLIKETSTRFKQTVIMITHDNDCAAAAGRIIRLEDGKVVDDTRRQTVSS